MPAHPTALRVRPPRPRRRRLLVLVFVAVLLLLFLPSLVTLGAEWPWFQALGYDRVRATRLVAKGLLGVGAGVVAFAFLYANLRFAQRGAVPEPVVLRFNPRAPALDVTHLLRRLAFPTALGLALLFGLAAAGGWLGVLQFLHRTPFGVSDPVFGRDVGYYVFTVPVMVSAIAFLTALTTVALLATIVLYVLRRGVVLLQRRVTVEPSARWHLAGLIALLVLLAALRGYCRLAPGVLEP